MLNVERTWEARTVSQFLPAAQKVILKTSLFLFLLAAGLLASCTLPASKPSVTVATRSAPEITIERVQVSQGAGVYVSGRSTLPDGACIKTELLIDGKAADWWPKDVCVTVDAGQWEILAGLGRKGAPERLEPGKEYEIHAWWPEDPNQVSTRFPFDLNGPKK